MCNNVQRSVRAQQSRFFSSHQAVTCLKNLSDICDRILNYSPCPQHFLCLLHLSSLQSLQTTLFFTSYWKCPILLSALFLSLSSLFPYWSLYSLSLLKSSSYFFYPLHCLLHSQLDCLVCRSSCLCLLFLLSLSFPPPPPLWLRCTVLAPSRSTPGPRPSVSP